MCHESFEFIIHLRSISLLIAFINININIIFINHIHVQENNFKFFSLICLVEVLYYLKQVFYLLYAKSVTQRINYYAFFKYYKKLQYTIM